MKPNVGRRRFTGRWVGAVRRLERLLFRGDWAVGLARVLGVRSEVVISRHRVEPRGAPRGLPPLRIAFASDFHVGPTTDPNVVTAAFEAIRSSRPDVVLLGGDFVNFECSAIDRIAAELHALTQVAPCYAVLGNHDWVAGAGYIHECLERHGIVVLTNRSARLAPPFEGFWICGLDDHWSGRPDAAAAFSGADGVRIALMHAPSGLLDIAGHRFDLALCGHTHGGQIALPGGRPLLLPNGPLTRRYPRGRYELGDGRTLIVSVGVGCAVLPLRVHADPEVLLCTLEAPAEGRGAV